MRHSEQKLAAQILELASKTSLLRKELRAAQEQLRTLHDLLANEQRVHSLEEQKPKSTRGSKRRAIVERLIEYASSRDGQLIMSEAAAFLVRTGGCQTQSQACRSVDAALRDHRNIFKRVRHGVYQLQKDKPHRRARKVRIIDILTKYAASRNGRLKLGDAASHLVRIHRYGDVIRAYRSVTRVVLLYPDTFHRVQRGVYQLSSNI